jgi:hypothetical protein
MRNRRARVINHPHLPEPDHLVLGYAVRATPVMALKAGTMLTDRAEWKSFGFEFKPGKLVFGST